MKDLGENGPPEETWVKIAAEAEHERCKQQTEGASSAEESQFIDPDQHAEPEGSSLGNERL